MRRFVVVVVALAAAAILLWGPPASAQQRVSVGQEWRYAGTVTLVYSQAQPGQKAQEESQKLRLGASATVVGKQQSRLEVVRFRNTVPVGAASGDARLWIHGTDEHDARPPEDMMDALDLPAPFGVSLKPGYQRTTKMPLFGNPPLLVPPMRLRVTSVEKIGARSCLRAERTVAGKLPLKNAPGQPFTLRLTEYSERFWVDRQSGGLVKYEGTAGLEAEDGEHVQKFRFTTSLALGGVRNVPMAECQSRRAQAQQLAALLKLVQEIPTSHERADELVKQAQAQLQQFQSDHPESPYLAAANSLGATLGHWEAWAERQKSQTLLVGKPAPPVQLKDLESKERTLGEYQGKIILLNFFASW
ncbi:MAG: hypothetical protein HY320_02075 [Armatimonadetes bacterium]|nr:hypothetical protein [Armatimonadota bacterium]